MIEALSIQVQGIVQGVGFRPFVYRTALRFKIHGWVRNAIDGVRIHAIRGDGYMASQEVILSAAGQTLTIRHDSTLREAYMPGVLLAIRSVASLQEPFTVGLECLMGL